MMMTMMMMMMTVQITVQVVCKLKNHPQKQNVQDMIKILRNAENVQCFNFGLLGFRVAAVLQRTGVKSLKSNKSRKAILDSSILLFILIRSSLVLQ